MLWCLSPNPSWFKKSQHGDACVQAGTQLEEPALPCYNCNILFGVLVCPHENLLKSLRPSITFFRQPKPTAGVPLDASSVEIPELPVLCGLLFVLDTCGRVAPCRKRVFLLVQRA